MWARAIIFGIELVGFVVLSIFVAAKFYKRHCSKKSEKYAIKNLKFNLFCYAINFAIIFAIFLFSYPSLIFLSYNKLILVSLVELASILIILLSYLKLNKIRDFTMVFILAISCTLILIISIDGIIGNKGFIIENKVAISEQTEKKIIAPTMFSKNQIGYTADIEGNIKTYVFYYQGNNGVWEYEELKASETKVEKIKDADTYIEKTVTITSYYKQEKKTLKEDYITTEENEKYTIYLNLNQMVEVKTD